MTNGVAPDELGPAVDPGTLVRLELPQPEIGSARIRATVLYIDRFGNVQLNLARAELEQIGITPGTRVELDLGVDRYYASAARTFADARAGDIILYEDAYENISAALPSVSATAMFS